MKVSGKQVTAARNLLGITQVELATAAGIDPSTILRFELGQIAPQRASMKKILDELERRGIEFTNGDRQPSTDPGIGVRLNLTKAAAYAQTAGQTRKEAEP